MVRVAHRIRADGVRHTTDGIPLWSFAPIPEPLNYPSSHKLSESSCAETMMWILWGNSLCLLPPPLFTPRGYCSIFTFLCFINHKHSHFSTAAFRCHYVQFPVVAGLYCRGHPPPMRKASTCFCLFSLSYITITPVLPIPSWRRKLATEFLKYLAVMVLATPPHGTVNHFPRHVICVLTHRYYYFRLPLL